MKRNCSSANTHSAVLLLKNDTDKWGEQGITVLLTENSTSWLTLLSDKWISGDDPPVGDYLPYSALMLDIRACGILAWPRTLVL
jgi:hypothetical protein